MEMITVIIIVAVLATLFIPIILKRIEGTRQAEAINTLTKMYRGYRVLVAEGIVDPATCTFTNHTSFNPFESDQLEICDMYCVSDLSWKALGFDRNINHQYDNLYFAYDFLRVGEHYVIDRENSLGTQLIVEGSPAGVAYRKISNNRLNNGLFPVNYDQRIYIYMNNGTIVKSDDYK